MAEWTKAMVLKTIVGQPTGGSNPSPSAANIPARQSGVTEEPADHSGLRRHFLAHLASVVGLDCYDDGTAGIFCLRDWIDQAIECGHRELIEKS
jgi:hypothetical protein